ncbi:MAG: hypothetical protein IKH88_02300 [Prevotella sp.]|nr:hypothetical protein [Prevotella sp.]
MENDIKMLNCLQEVSGAMAMCLIMDRDDKYVQESANSAFIEIKLHEADWELWLMTSDDQILKMNETSIVKSFCKRAKDFYQKFYKDVPDILEDFDAVDFLCISAIPWFKAWMKRVTLARLNLMMENENGRDAESAKDAPQSTKEGEVEPLLTTDKNGDKGGRKTAVNDEQEPGDGRKYSPTKKIPAKALLKFLVNENVIPEMEFKTFTTAIYYCQWSALYSESQSQVKFRNFLVSLKNKYFNEAYYEEIQKQLGMNAQHLTKHKNLKFVNALSEII